MPIENLGSFRWFLIYFKEKENCTAAYKQDRNTAVTEVKTMLTPSYLRTGVHKKDFVHGGSVERI